jgi:cellulose 1,4-beta-cellobiosidase
MSCTPQTNVFSGGGNGFSGSTSCVSGYSCVASNDYYSQCVPAAQAGAGAGNSSPQPTPAQGGGGAATTMATVTKASPAANTDNPLAGWGFYANSYYASEISSLASPSLAAKGSSTWAAKATEVAKVGTFVWLDTRDKVPSIAGYAADVQKQNAAGAKVVLPLVVYDLPDRDCAAYASNGELSIANNGETLYKGYIDSIVEQIKAYPDVKFLLVVGKNNTSTSKYCVLMRSRARQLG